MQLAPGIMRILANNPEQEQAEEEIELAYQGDEFEIGFNASYLLDVLNTVPSGEGRLVMQDATCSALIQSDSKPERFENLYVVMPLRL
jgi:DNA polymerase III subunit beta